MLEKGNLDDLITPPKHHNICTESSCPVSGDKAEDRPLVTIAIPIYNADHYLEFAVRSIINQTYDNWELLLMEDGSKDNSAEIAKAIASEDQRIIYISDGVNKGLVYRLNQSIMLAKGKYYARMDADDIMAVSRIEKEVKCLIDNPNIDVVGCSAMLIDEANKICGSQNMKGVEDFFIHPSVMGKTEWFKKHRYDPSAVRIEDKDLWLRTSTKNVFYNIEEPLLFYRSLSTIGLSQILSSNKRQRGLFTHYKKYGKSFIWGCSNVLKTYIKDILFSLVFLVGGENMYMRIRGRRALPSNLCLNEADLKMSISEMV